jgi:hypothetical protein
MPRIVIGATLLVGVLAHAAPGTVTDGDLQAFVEKRVHDWQATAKERKLDEIGWAKGIRQALRLGQEHHRPVLLFTLDGKMDIGRC